MMFDIQGAKKEGYTDSEIAEYLAPQIKFNLTDARKEGYSDSEISDYLAKIETVERKPSLWDKTKDIGREVSETVAGAGLNIGAGFLGGASRLYGGFGAKGLERTYAKQAQELKDIAVESPVGAETLPAKIYQGMGAAIPELLKWGPGKVGLATGVVLSGLQGFREGNYTGAIRGIADRLALGKIFSAISKTGLTPVQKAGAMGGTMGGKVALETGGDVEETTTATLVGTLLPLLGGYSGKKSAIQSLLIREGVRPQQAESMASSYVDIINKVPASEWSHLKEAIKQKQLEWQPEPTAPQQRGGRVFVSPTGEAEIIGDISASQAKLGAVKEPAGMGESKVTGIPAIVRKNYMIEEAENAYNTLKQNNFAIKKYINDRIRQIESEDIQKEIEWTPESKLQILSEILPQQSNIVGSKFMEIRDRVSESIRTGKDLLSAKETQFWNDIMAHDSPFAGILKISKEKPIIEPQWKNVRGEPTEIPVEPTKVAPKPAILPAEQTIEVGQVIGQAKTREVEPVSTKIARVLGKETEIELLGKLTEEQKIDQMIKDAVTQKMSTAKALEKKGDIVTADESKQEGMKNAEMIRATDGPLVEKRVNEALSGIVPVAPTEVKPAVPPIEEVGGGLGEAGFLRIGKEQLFKTGEKTPIQKAVRGVDKFFGAISTRVGNIDPSLKARLKRHAFEQSINTSRDYKVIKDFAKKSAKIPEIDQVTITQLLHNQDFEGAIKILKKYGISGAEFQKAHNLKENITDKGIASGMKIERDVEFHWPMRVRDYEGLMKHLEETGRGEASTQIQKAMKEVEKEFPDLTIEERGAIADKMLRGWTQGRVLLSDPRYAKARTLHYITYEDARFYEPFHKSLITFIYDMNSKIADNRLFGKGNQPTRADMKLRQIYDFDYSDLGIESREGINASIGKLLDTITSRGKKLTNEQERDLRSMINSYLFPQRVNPLVRGAKAITYTLLLSDVSTAFAQSISEGVTIGLYARTPQKFFKYYLPAWKNVITRSGLKMADIGIDSARADFERKGLVSFVAKGVLSPLRLLDVANKEVLENTIYRTYKDLAKNKDPKFMADLEIMFGREAERVRSEIMSGEKTDDAMFSIFSTVSENHPISALEVPQKYLDSSAWNGLMTLHTYALKQIDVYRTKVYNELKEGNIKGGIKNMVGLTIGLIGMGMPINYIQDYIRGKDPEDWKQYFIDSALQIIGMNKYMFERASKAPKTEKVQSIVRAVSPAIINIASNIVADTITAFQEAKENKQGEPIPKDYRAIQYIPLIGREIYGRTEARKNLMKKYKIADYHARIAEAIFKGDDKLTDELYDKAEKEGLELSKKAIDLQYKKLSKE